MESYSTPYVNPIVALKISEVIKNGVPYGIRTRVAAVKGRCPRPLDERDVRVFALKTDAL